MLTDLQDRWRKDRNPQAGLRLAEEWRRQGERERAEVVLDEIERRLVDEPRDLASRVALGSARIALGQPERAASVLEQVVEKDPTHLKANKLLVEVYLDLGQSDKARDRLDLYRLLNEGDPEIEVLEGLVVGGAVPSVPEAVIIGGRRLSVAGGDPFGGLAAEPAVTPSGDLLFDLTPEPEPAAEPEPEPAAEPESEPAAATATLGTLYREQGHREEAARAFQQVIAAEPDNQRARDGLEALAGEPEPAPAARASVPAAFSVDLDPDVDRERRIGILRDYLNRIQRGREASAR